MDKNNVNIFNLGGLYAMHMTSTTTTINSATAVVIAAGEQVQRSAVAKTYKNMQDMILLLLHKYTYIISLNKEEKKQIA